MSRKRPAYLRRRVLAADQFQLLEKLGTGSFGTVYRALDTVENKVCAIKKIDLESSGDEIDEIQREIAVLAECNNEHITKYYGCFVNNYKLWIIMEYLGGGSCLDLIKSLGGLPEAVIALVLSEILLGLQYLHSTGKIHRDIKAANILVSEDGIVKIADFGVAAQLSNNLSRRNTFVGTPFWMAPEVIGQEDYSFSADVWSLGITAIELANAEPPLSHLHPMKVLFYIPKNPPPQLDETFSHLFRDFVGKCLQKNPHDRWTVAQLLKHDFLQRARRDELVRLVSQLQVIAPKDSGTVASGTIDVTQLTENMNDSDEWDFDTVRPESSKVDVGTIESAPNELKHMLETSSHKARSISETSTKVSNLPISAISSPISDLQFDSSVSSVMEGLDTLKDGSTNGTGRSNLVKIFKHASLKFNDPTLREVAEILTIEPLTSNVENYLTKKIGKTAVEKYDLQPRNKMRKMDPVEEILLAKWINEAKKRH